MGSQFEKPRASPKSKGIPATLLFWGQRPPALSQSAGDGGVCPAVHGDPVWAPWAGYLSRFLPHAWYLGASPCPGLPWSPEARLYWCGPRFLADDRWWPGHTSVVGYVCRAAVPMILEPGLKEGALQAQVLVCRRASHPGGSRTTPVTVLFSKLGSWRPSRTRSTFQLRGSGSVSVFLMTS